MVRCKKCMLVGRFSRIVNFLSMLYHLFDAHYSCERGDGHA